MPEAQSGCNRDGSRRNEISRQRNYCYDHEVNKRDCPTVSFKWGSE